MTTDLLGGSDTKQPCTVGVRSEGDVAKVLESAFGRSISWGQDAPTGQYPS